MAKIKFINPNNYDVEFGISDTPTRTTDTRGTVRANSSYETHQTIGRWARAQKASSNRSQDVIGEIQYEGQVFQIPLGID